MDSVAPFIFFAIVAMVFVAIIASNLAAAEKVNDSLRRLAQAYGGKALRGGLFDHPSASFIHNGSPVRVDYYSTGGKHKTYYTQVHLEWPDRQTRCEIYPANLLTRLGALIGMADIEIGSPQFDEVFHISGNSPQAVRKLLNADVQARIFALRQLPKNYHIYVQFSHGKLLVKKLGRISDFEGLSRLTTLSLQLRDAVLTNNAQGITFLTAVAERPEAPYCPVCGEPITTNLVQCRSCHTVHHQECWEYYGACATYGCGRKLFYHPKPARRAS